jgi:hypothetical protein
MEVHFEESRASTRKSFLMGAAVFAAIVASAAGKPEAAQGGAESNNGPKFTLVVVSMQLCCTRDSQLRAVDVVTV